MCSPAHTGLYATPEQSHPLLHHEDKSSVDELMQNRQVGVKSYLYMYFSKTVYVRLFECIGPVPNRENNK